ncbi:MAG: DNA cytosine methyltransferase [Oscillospiraceae bacterium]|jgi:DNA (cytosine-5)-methyltransferase 1|nr:DNA cytosine methyltransferase [Oscillospiraceae bacterium]
MRAQVNLLDEIIVDNFAGGGGASTGMELATGRVVDIAINHDPDAILMHKTNHPHTTHYQASVWDVDPVEVCAGRPVGLAWFSPDCKHFSKAKGGKPVDKSIRGLAWIALRWAGTVRPRVIILENVEEFQTWGPVRRGKPVKSKKGQTFQKFVRQLYALGYDVQWRELVAADYGAPTTRKRFFLIARCDGRAIIWPEATHASRDSQEVKNGEKLPWRSASEIIDWSLPCPSIFDTRETIKAKYGLTAQRPLRPNTLRRVARGVDKFVIQSANPFIIPVGYGERKGQAPRVHDAEEPLPTAVGVAKHGVVQPYMVQVNHAGDFRGQSLKEPVQTITAKLGEGLVCPAMIQYHTEQTERVRGQGVTDPIMTIDAANRYGVAAPTLVKYYSGEKQGQDVAAPLHTITTKDREGLAISHLVKLHHNDVGGPVDGPLATITAEGTHHGLVVTRVEKMAPGADLQRWPQIRALLNEYCGYHLANDEVLLFLIGGVWYYMADIGLRMLSPKELYRANGFPPDYIIDRDYEGHEYGRSKQVARCGNAVPPPFATALVRANLPEWCGLEITTMAELEKAVAV